MLDLYFQHELLINTTQFDNVGSSNWFERELTAGTFYDIVIQLYWSTYEDIENSRFGLKIVAGKSYYHFTTVNSDDLTKAVAAII